MCRLSPLFRMVVQGGEGPPFFSSLVGTFAPSPYVAYIGKEIADCAPHPREEGKCERGSARERKMSLDLGAPLLRGRNVRSRKKGASKRELSGVTIPFLPSDQDVKSVEGRRLLGPSVSIGTRGRGLWSEGKRNCLTRVPSGMGRAGGGGMGFHCRLSWVHFLTPSSSSSTTTKTSSSL